MLALAVLFCAAVPLSCSDGSDGDVTADEVPTERPFGDLAVTSNPPTGAESGLEGTLSLADGCVSVVDSSGGRHIPLWPAQLVGWDEATEALLYFASEDATPVVVVDGAALSLGGSPLSPAEPPVAVPAGSDLSELLEELSIPWVNRPQPDCVDRSVSAFSVGSLTIDAPNG